MTSVVIWRYRENKIKSFKGGGGCCWEGGPIMAGETLYPIPKLNHYHTNY